MFLCIFEVTAFHCLGSQVDTDDLLYSSFAFVVCRHTKSVACLVSTMCMGFGSRQILVWESRNVGVKWSNIGDGPTVEDDFSVGIAIGMMMLDTVIYLIIAWYTEAVFPGEYGIPQPWYFPVMTSYWIGKPSTNAVDSEENVSISSWKCVVAFVVVCVIKVTVLVLSPNG